MDILHSGNGWNVELGCGSRHLERHVRRTAIRYWRMASGTVRRQYRQSDAEGKIEVRKTAEGRGQTRAPGLSMYWNFYCGIFIAE